MCTHVSVHVICMVVHLYVCVFLSEHVRLCLHSICVALRWAVHTDVRKWSHFPRNPDYPLFLPSSLQGEAQLHKEGPEPCLSLSLHPTPSHTASRPVLGGRARRVRHSGVSSPRLSGAGTGLGCGKDGCWEQVLPCWEKDLMQLGAEWGEAKHA